ncbi:MAG TPA: hypothetical protein PLE14_03105 [Anaerolineales bacterium]|nr:hypothetical protein [Anaerolineales bacterium]HNO31112.1 hypothetical protein [Anaerolineales bacterium]
MEKILDLVWGLFSALLCFVPPLVFVGIIGFAIYKFVDAQNNQIKWCEKCNSWQKMKRRIGEVEGWDCPNCRWTNQNSLGACPTCGWHQRYENRTVSHRGPFRKIDRTPVTPFWGVQEEYWAYEERIQCPKHGIFTAYIPVDAYQNSHANSNEDYDD